MSNHFIPSFHYQDPSTKLTPAWCKKAIDYLFFNSANVSLLAGKNIREIEEYASGDYSLEDFKKLYKSAKRALEKNGMNNPNSDDISSNLQYMVVPMIPPKLNSAIAIIQKIPTEISCVAIDPLAAQKKKEDIEFLKKKPGLEADLQEIADRLQIDKVDLGTTKHSDVPHSDNPFGLDLNEADEEQVFTDLLYNLNVTASFETVLQIFYEIKKINEFRLLETKDQFRYGISSHIAYQNSMTGLPDIDYEFPGNIHTPHSDLPDFSDNTHRIIYKKVTPLELFNYFSDEIPNNEDYLEEIVNGKDSNNLGYCACEGNGKPDGRPANWGSLKMDLLYCEVKSVDWLGISTTEDGKTDYISDDTGDEKKIKGKIWAQNTYCFYWLKNTKHFFGIHRLGYAHRKEGLESYSSFSSNIYKSQNKSAVELAIPENKRAQIAYIKMMYALIMSLPAGRVIDIKGMRGVVEGLKDESNEYTVDSLIEMALQQNTMIIDTEGFDGKNDGQLKPYYEIPGGVRTEMNGYQETIADANLKINQFLGTNDALTGQSVNPDALIGLEKLRINSSLNALYYATQGLEEQYQKLFNCWATVIKSAVEAGGAVKKAIINFIGSQKVSLIDGLDDLPLHTMGVKVTIKMREEEREELKKNIYNLKAQGVLSVADEYQISAFQNPKDKFKYLAVKEKIFLKRQDKIRQEQAAQQQAMVDAQGKNQLQSVQAQAQSEKELVYAKGEVQAKILQLSNQLGLHSDQFNAVIDRQHQLERNNAQTEKSISVLQEKSRLENQKPLI